MTIFFELAVRSSVENLLVSAGLESWLAVASAGSLWVLVL